jgi:hypothetical protein
VAGLSIRDTLPSMNTRLDGYHGIWFELGQKSRYGDKYSGGLGTYTAKHVPLAVHAPQVHKTFFTYGGTTAPDQRHLLIMASCYDHDRHVVPRPTLVHDKQGVDDPHDNAAICLDEHGHVWIFVSGRGRRRPGFKYRSREPFSVDDFERVSEEEMTYPQPWWIEGEGFVHLFTKYTGVRELYWNRSRDGRRWTDHRKLAGMGGHYQTSRRRGRRIVTAFNMHPDGDVDRRTNLYFAQTDDLGETWRTITGEPIDTPMTDPDASALVRDYRREGRLVYMKDIGFDADGRPVILCVVSGHHQPGPGGDPRIWTVVHWTGEAWAFHEVARSTHNYDTGSLDVAGETWRVIGPIDPGPQHWGAGGEIAIRTSTDRGRSWRHGRPLTHDSPLNHNYVRRPIDAAPEFDAFWADGDPDALSPSRLYFTDRAGSAVWRLPTEMATDLAEPQAIENGPP